MGTVRVLALSPIGTFAVVQSDGQYLLASAVEHSFRELTEEDYLTLRELDVYASVDCTMPTENLWRFMSEAESKWLANAGIPGVDQIAKLGTVGLVEIIQKVKHEDRIGFWSLLSKNQRDALSEVGFRP